MKQRSIRKNNDRAVSPVVGVMLMLVVTIIIAAVVSAFSGGLAGGQKKIPQATMQADFSIIDGMTIRHAGGDALPMADIQFVIWDGPTFGPNVEQSSKQVLDMRLLRDTSGLAILTSDGIYNKTAMLAGDTLTIDTSDSRCNKLQPNIAPSDYTPGDTVYPSTGVEQARWALCISNPANIGKEFILTLSDKNGNLIAKTNVKVTG